MEKSLINKFKIAGLGAGITCLLFSSGFLVLFTPFPAYFVSTVYGKKLGRWTIMLSVLAACCLYLLALPLLYGLAENWSLAKVIYILPGAGLAGYFNIQSAMIFGLMYLIYFMSFAVLFSEGLDRSWSLFKWFGVSVSASVGFLLIIYLIVEFMGVSVSTSLKAYMTEILNEVIQAQESAGIDGVKIFALKSAAPSIIATAIRIIPSILFLIGIAVAFLNFLLANWLIKVPGRFAHFGEVKTSSIPFIFVWGLIGAGFLYFANAYYLNNELLKIVLLNGLLVLSGLYFIQGLLVFLYYFAKLKVRFIRFMFYALMIVFFQFIAPAIAIIGVMDLWFDFRRLNKTKEINKSKRSIPWK